MRRLWVVVFEVFVYLLRQRFSGFQFLNAAYNFVAICIKCMPYFVYLYFDLNIFLLSDCLTVSRIF